MEDFPAELAALKEMLLLLGAGPAEVVEPAGPVRPAWVGPVGPAGVVVRVGRAGSTSYRLRALVVTAPSRMLSLPLPLPLPVPRPLTSDDA